MKRIILVRHATAVDVGPRGSDFQRRLKKRGRREAAIMADRVASSLAAPDLAVTSPAARAIETARIFAERLGLSAERVVAREQLYGGLLPDEFLRIVREMDDAHDALMIFGHDPSFSEFAAYLVPGFTAFIPKAGVVAIDLDRASWSAVRAGDGKLVVFERPPAPEVQKKIEEDLIDRLAMEIRTAVFASLRSLGVPENRDVVKAVARASSRLALVARPFAAAASPAAPKGRKRSPSSKRVLTKRRAKRVAKGPRRSSSASVAKRRARSRA
ncbi:MAG TPA: histidine phosphatase family protein [Candidatus Krumholzibacteria bacterium]|nr:histidine phosphatase family protein [Candidatus Krumholzibacteria bacterium]